MPNVTPNPPESPDASVDIGSLYQPPADFITKAIRTHLVDFHIAYLKRATFFCLATAGAGGLDASPRGGPAGFVHVPDPHTIAFADWPGNNRVESFRNLGSDSRVALLFLFPGLDVFIRINGRARISVEPALLAAVAEGKRMPKAATVVAVEEVLFHCGKAINRAGLWDPSSHIDRRSLPTMGEIFTQLTHMEDVPAEAVDAHYSHSMKHDLY